MIHQIAELRRYGIVLQYKRIVSPPHRSLSPPAKKSLLPSNLAISSNTLKSTTNYGRKNTGIVSSCLTSKMRAHLNFFEFQRCVEGFTVNLFFYFNFLIFYCLKMTISTRALDENQHDTAHYCEGKECEFTNGFLLRKLT